jgi:segregation and condensation protein A
VTSVYQKDAGRREVGMEKLQFKLEVFEGPLDLLLQLISKNKVSIYNIPILQITDQYFEVLERMKELDLDVSSEFLVMAAQLVYIKSRMLLPAEKEENEEGDPREELAQRLLEYQRYKLASEYLKEREFASRYMFFKAPDEIIPKTVPYEGGYSMDELIAAFNDILERSQRRVPPPRKTFEGIVQREVVSVRDKEVHILKLLAGRGGVMFADIFQGMRTKPELVAAFLALLELIRGNRITANYDKSKKDFVIVGTGKMFEEKMFDEKNSLA